MTQSNKTSYSNWIKLSANGITAPAIGGSASAVGESASAVGGSASNPVTQSNPSPMD